MKPFYQNFKLGVLGGGQLGRMLIQSAIDLNMQISVLDPDKDAPCKYLADEFVVGEVTDFDTVYRFGKGKDLITIEIENVNTEALQKLEEEGVNVYPQPRQIKLIQDKRVQKQFYKENGIPTSEFVLIENQEDLFKHIDFLPAVQKLGRAGYDGRGVQKIEKIEDISKGFDAPSVLEKLIDFEKEISVIVARNVSGQIATYPVTELVFHPTQNLVEFLFSPADISYEVGKEAKRIAINIIEKLGIVGLLAVEMFVTKDGKIVVNEIAPRTHNSGHQTIEANFTSQFQQHLRAILNLPLGATTIKMPSAMVNLLGESGYTGLARYQGIEQVMKTEGVYIHLYGKQMTKPFRKMGHVTILDHDVEKLKLKAKFVKDNLKVIA
ncbi:MAG TPA: 5-(carboxyamino)imidazole ribonucleotide synthase [Cytophagales bacterium]|nr:5-(carboxyamino)imidazole ribonucleotide synthase [Cytophagales bacterium]